MTDPIIPEIFTDGAGRYRFSGGVVRIDLVSATEAANDEKEAQTTVTHRLILSPEGFLRTVSAMNTLLNQLVKSGVIKQERRQKSDTDGT
jgi:hypothetical protein